MRKGAITIFFSLVIGICIPMTAVILEGARTRAARSYVQGLCDMAIDSVFAEYHKGLFEQFDLMFIDGSYGTGTFSEWLPVQRAEQYIAYNLYPEQGLPVTRSIDMWKVRPVHTAAEEMILATDFQGDVLKSQMIDFMRKDTGLALLGSLKEQMPFYNKYERASEDYKQEQKEQEKRIRELEEEEAEVGYGGMPIEDTPLAEIEELKKLSILQLVVKDKEKLSNRKTRLTYLATGRNWNKGYGSIWQDKDLGAVTSKLLVYEYLLRKMGNAVGEQYENHLLYELEYIIAGRESDIENLEYVINRIILIREGINFAYLMSDPVKKGEAMALAAAAVGAVPLPGVVKAAQMLILLGWAYGESILDVQDLMEGKKLPFMKSERTWKLKLSNITSLAREGGDEEISFGMGYQDYLRMLLFAAKDTKSLPRAMDMIEGRLRLNGSPNFHIDHCIHYMKIGFEWEQNTVFTEYLQKRKNYSRNYYMQKEFSY